MINTSSVSKFLEELLDDNTPGAELLDDLRIMGIYSGNFGDPAFNWGGFGFLPISGFSTGDIAALRPIPGRPIKEWPVMQVPHSGDPGETIASSLATFVAVHLTKYEDAERDELEDKKDAILELAEFFGDKEGRAKAVIEAMLADELGGNESDHYRLAEGDASALTRFHSLSEDGAEAEAWEKLYKDFPDYPAVWIELFKAWMESDPDKVDRSLAWKIATMDIQLDGDYKTIRQASKYVVEHDGKKEYGSSHSWPAVEAMAAKQSCGKHWFLAAQAFEKDGDFVSAYSAYKNASYWISSETGNCISATWMGAKRSAEQLGDPNLAALFDSLEEAEDEDLDAVLAEYDAADAERAAAEAAQAQAAPFFEAARAGDWKSLLKQIESGANVNAVDQKTGYTALHTAAEAGNTEIMQGLLDHGADIEAKTFQGHTPLMLAAQAGQTEAVRMLLERNPSLDSTTTRTETALYFAAKSGFTEIVEMLLARGANPDIKNVSEQTALFTAAFDKQEAAALALVRAGAKVSIKDFSGQTALHWAASQGMRALVQALLEKGAKPNAKDGDGETPISFAEAEGHDDIVALLKGEKPPAVTAYTDEEMAALKSMSERWDTPLNKLKKLDDLNCSFSDTGDEDLSWIYLLPALKEVVLSNCPNITDKAVEHIAKCQHIEAIVLSATKVTDAGLKILAGIPTLSRLFIDECPVTDRGFAEIARMKNLRWLRANSLPVSDEAVAKFAELEHMERLELPGTQITDRACEIIAGLPIQELDLSGTKITDAGIAKLKKLKKLQKLNLENTGVSDECFAAIGGMTKLDDLNLSGTKVTGKGISALKPLSKLLALKLSGSKLADANVAELKSLSSLRVLELEKTKITDASINHLKALKHLNALIITGTKISGEGKKKLKGAMPHHVSFSWD